MPLRKSVDPVVMIAAAVTAGTLAAVGNHRLTAVVLGAVAGLVLRAGLRLVAWVRRPGERGTFTRDAETRYRARQVPTPDSAEFAALMRCAHGKHQ